MNPNKRKKTVIFKQLLPIVEKMIDEGYTQEPILAVLKDEHNLELTKGTLSSYVARFSSRRLENEPPTINTVESNNIQSMNTATTEPKKSETDDTRKPLRIEPDKEAKGNIDNSVIQSIDDVIRNAKAIPNI